MKCAFPWCDLPEEDHHYFRPRTCECDPADWRDGVISIPVCKAYEEDPRFAGSCKACEHPKECHKTT